MEDLSQLDATSLSALIGQGVVRPSDLMAATLARIAAVNPAVNAIVSLNDGDTLMDDTPVLGGGGITGRD